MKRLSVIFISLLLVLGLVACDSTADSRSSASGSEVQNSSEPSHLSVSDTGNESNAVPSVSTNNTASNGGKTLVVYYSASGNTESAANYIAKATNADIFELKPTDPYTDADLNWTDENSRVVREHNDPSARVVALEVDTVKNWDEYDTVFIGYPIWWGIAAWPVDGFIKANDFTGKTVIPFCTSASSGFGESGKLLAQMAGTGNWLEGQRFTSGVSEATVRTWVEGLNLK
ncbi:MAG: flavodoxin [Acutalibacteraceae bacterium]